MSTSGRKFLTSVGAAVALGAIDPGRPESLAAVPSTKPSAETRFPAKSDFAIPEGITFINSAYTHPMPIVGVEASKKYLELRSQPDIVMHELGNIDIKSEFAALINAKRSEISYVPNTSTGENLVVNGLDIPHTDGNVVTDELHFEGALLHLGELQKQNGLDLRIVKARDWRINVRDVEEMVDSKTKLIEISLVAMDNGFQHDLKSVCDLAHSRGAYVYADIVQAVGNTPIDVRASGVDFCAASSFKWLMGDFGLGFLYVKEDLLDRVIGRTQYGYYEAQSIDSHIVPGEPPAATPYTWELDTIASGHFEVGTQAYGVVHVLSRTLPYIRSLGVENILAHRQPMLKRLREEMPRLGFALMTPPETTSALISFAVKDAKTVRERVKRAKVNVRVADHYMRISPTVFNDMKDIDKLLEALS